MRRICGSLILTGVLGLAGSARAQAPDECLACHGEADLKASDGRSLFVDGPLFSASPHSQAAVQCTDCHGGAEGAAQGDAPHPLPLPATPCADCHTDVSEAHAASRHKEAGVECRTCHDPHTPGPGLHLAKRVERCMECHSIEGSHTWLPETRRHLAAVECAACHGSGGKRQVFLEFRRRSGEGVHALKPEELARAAALPGAASGTPAPAAALSSEQLALWVRSLENAGLGQVEIGVEVLLDDPKHDFTIRPQAAKDCHGCHAEKPAFLHGFALQLPGPEGKAAQQLAVERSAVPLRPIERFADSVHGQAGVDCAACHQEMSSLAEARAGGAAQIGTVVCGNCHGVQVFQYKDSVHARASDKTCFGCHNPHANVPFRSLRGEERQAICLTCHAAVRHDWLPQQTLHFKFLECATCHSPRSRKGVSFSFEGTDSGRKLDVELLEALGEPASGNLASVVDADGNGVASSQELLAFLDRLGAKLPEPARLRPQVLILEPHHDFSKGAEQARECTQCHSGRAEFYDKLFVQLPAPGGGVTSLPVERDILGQMGAARQLGDLYLLGESRISRKNVAEVLEAIRHVGYRWIDILGLLLLLGGLGFVGLHSLLRLLTIPRRRRRRP
jgi:predicted CXXCH cytochrome family protein